LATLADIWLEQYGDEMFEVATGEALFEEAALEVGLCVEDPYIVAVLAWFVTIPALFGGVNWTE